MKRDKLKGLVLGLALGIGITGGTVLGAIGSQNIEVFYDNIKLFVDGEEITPKDSNGTIVEPFIYNGTTYLPVRAIGTAVGKEVSWDGAEKIVYLGAKPGTAENWLDVCGPYSYRAGIEYRFMDNAYFTMSGKKYTNGFVLCPGAGSGNRAEAMFNLDGKYKNVSFKVGNVDGSMQRNAIMKVYVDGIVEYSAKIEYTDVAKTVTIPLNNALQMKIELLLDEIHGNTKIGFSEGVFE